MSAAVEAHSLKDQPERLVVLVGAPNSGKTTLYNWLTNSRFKTVNYPGATVEYSLGRSAPQFESDFFIMDTPGTYSLYPKSGDEEVTRACLEANPILEAPVGKVICVVDGTQMKRHLGFVLQLQNAGFSVVVAVTMMDLLRKAGLKPDLSALSSQLGCPVVGIEGLLGGGIPELLKAAKNIPFSKVVHFPSESSIDFSQQAQWAEKVVHASFDGHEKKIESIYDKTAALDSWFLHPVLGLFIFVALMFTLFSSIFWLAAPAMDLIDGSFTWLAESALALAPDSLLADFFSAGVIASVGAVMVFVPQIFILFFGIGLMENTGYLARAATLIDRPFSKIGMSGRSFVPLLSGFACAVPAIMATRNMTSKRDRWITNFIIPFMTCSARLPVYALLLSFLFLDQPAWKAGLALTGLYFGSLLLGAGAAAIVNQILAKEKISSFMMELPLYRRPLTRSLFTQSLTRTFSYVKRAGPPIFIFSLLVWVGTTFPRSTPENPLEHSYLAQIGHVIEPVFTPMGGDWRTGVGLMTAFAARETFVSSMAVLFRVTDESEDGQMQGLLKVMNEAQAPDGGLLFTISSVLGLIIFFAVAMQCLSTFAIAWREMGSWKFAWLQLIVFNIAAYVLAVGAVQGLRALGVP